MPPTVLEARSFYAVSVIVKAKCIDIDRRRIATAQEQHSTNKSHRESDQWQSLIALYKQTRHIISLNEITIATMKQQILIDSVMSDTA